MDENLKTSKTTHAKNLQSFKVNTTISVLIDANVNIKKILNIQAYLFETKAECGNEKAIVTGKIGTKVLYIDTDNQTNIITETQSFSETYTNSAITSDCVLNISNHFIEHSVLSTDSNLKIGFEINFNPVMYVNLPLISNNNYENMIIKKSEITTNTITNYVNTSFDFTSIFETKENITKVLFYNAHYTNLTLTCNENYATAEGKILSTIIYETTENEQIKINQITDCFNVKTDINIENLTSDCLLDVNFNLDLSKQDVTTETEDDNNIISVINKINVVGVCSKNIKLEVIDDLYSVVNEVDVNHTNREFVKNVNNHFVEEYVMNDISLTNDESAIDYLISNLEIVPITTNTYIKENTLYLEGVINSNLMFIDENKEFKSKKCEVPFIINTKLTLPQLDCCNHQITVTDCNAKVKRGTKIELEYKLCVNVSVYEQDNKQIINSVKIGKALDFSNYDYQIYLTKPNENTWELCKRIKTTIEELNKYNKNLPLEFTGKEKVIIKR